MATIKELLGEVKLLDKELTTLAARAESVSKVMSGSSWGVGQLAVLQANLAEITTMINALSGKKVQLLGQAESQKLSQYEILLKKIATAQESIANKSALQRKSSPESPEFRNLTTQIANAERALKSYLTTKNRLYDASGNRVQYAKPIGPEIAPITDYGNVGPKQSNQSLINKRLDLLNKEKLALEQLKAEYSQQTGNVLPGYKERLDQINTAMDRLAAAQQKVSAGAKPGYIPGGFGVNKEGGFGNQSYGPDQATKVPETDKQLNARLKAERKANLEKKLQMEREELKAYIAAHEKEMQYAASLGYTDPINQLKKRRGGAAGAYSENTYQRKDQYGAIIEDKVRVDPQGNASHGIIPKANQSFAQGITKDLGDLAKWSIAIAAIYGPINAASEAIKEMVENEVKLATVSIALNENVANTNKVFIDVDKAARASGETITGVVDAFGAAYTATGRITNEYQRYNSTIELLNDSLTLSKLSTLDQAGAIDVLTAALYQVGDAPTTPAGGSDAAVEALSKGTEIIDQWVQISKVASVTVETLATGVAVLGDSAETAGLSIEQMNAMIATLSEVSLSSGKETANIAKALIGNYQQESAVKELNRLGIAVVDTTGKTRQFLDVMKDVASLRSSKIIGDEDFGRLTLALGGGGIRRQKDVSAFIENFGRMQQLSGMQGGAGGASTEALGKQLDTVSTSGTNLSNALTNLAQTMGNEGGLLNAMSTTLKTGTLLVDLFDKMAGFAGKAGPLLMVAGAMRLMMGAGGVTGLTNSVFNNVTGPIANRFGGDQNKAFANAGMMTGMNPLYGGRAGANFGLPSAIALALPAIQSLQAGKPKEALAGLAGGAVGALMTAGSPIGILIGNAAGEAMVKAVTYDSAFMDFFAGRNQPKEGLTSAVGINPDELGKAAFANMGLGNAFIGELIAGLSKGSYQSKDLGKSILHNITLGLTEDAPGTFKTPEAVAMEYAKKTDPALYKKMQFEYAKQGQLPEGEFSSLTNRQKEISSTGGTKATLEAMQRAETDRLRTSLIKGDIKQADYGNRMTNLSAFAVTAPRVMAGMESEIGGVGDAFKSVEEAYKSYLDVASSGNTELINGINSQLAEIDKVQNLVDKWDPATVAVPIQFTVNGVAITGDKAAFEKLIPGLKEGMANYTAAAAQQVRLDMLPIRDTYGGSVNTTSTKDVGIVAEDTVKAQDKLYSNLTKEEFASLQESWDPFFILVEEAGEVFYKQVTDAAGKKVDKALFGEMYQNAQEEGRIAKKDTGVDWSSSTATAAQIRSAEQRAPAYVAQLEQEGYKSEATDAIFSTSDEQIIKAHGDQKVIQFLLQQILDTEKKQLQGIWNLPEGASFWVPLQSILDQGSGTNGVTQPEVTKPADWASQITPPYIKPDEVSNYVKGDKWWEEAKVGYPDESDQPRLRSSVTTESTSTSAEGANIIDQLLSKLMALLGSKTGPADVGGRGRRGGLQYEDLTGEKSGKSWSGRSGGENAQTINTKLDLRFTSTTQLVVDGRMLANIIKPYLAADMLRSNESGGSVTRSYVI